MNEAQKSDLFPSGLQESSAWQKVKDLSKEQAQRFGLNLKLPKEEVDRVLKEEEIPGAGALAMFNAWKSNLEASGRSENQQFLQALNDAGIEGI